jgi:tRNA 2-thiouridine synthesizing protein E
MRGFVFCYTAASLIKVVIIMLIFEGKEIETDTEGYLKESSQWSEPLAVVIAENEGISLSPEHWEVVRFVRDFYLEFNTSPAIRMLVKAMANKFGEEKGNSRYLYRLFPKGQEHQTIHTHQRQNQTRRWQHQHRTGSCGNRRKGQRQAQQKIGITQHLMGAKQRCTVM